MQSLLATSVPNPFPHRLFIINCATQIQFLIDIGADLCVYPRSAVSSQREKSVKSLVVYTILSNKERLPMITKYFQRLSEITNILTHNPL